LFELIVMEVVVTTGAIRLANSGQNVTTNKPTASFFTGRMPFLSPNQQCQSTEGNGQELFIVVEICLVMTEICPFRERSLIGRSETIVCIVTSLAAAKSTNLKFQFHVC